MNALDVSVAYFLNQFAQRSWIIDCFMHLIETTALFKGMAFMAILWWLWFKPGEKQQQNRERLTLILPAGILAVVAARAIAFSLPFRPRPINTPMLHLRIIHLDPLINWSSFPSDHAALFFALATGFCLISRKLGFWAMIYTTVFICLPRMYLGLHWTTDILGGAAIGIGTSLLVNNLRFLLRITHLPLRFMEYNAAAFYALAFVLTFEVAQILSDVRSFGGMILRLFGASS
jgi:membrane-associated phospholipid phosphatase